MDYMIPAVFLLGGLLSGGNAVAGIMRGKLYFFEFAEDALVNARQNPLFFLIALAGSVLICIGGLAVGTVMLWRMSA